MTGKRISLLSVLIVSFVLSLFYFVYSQAPYPTDASGARPRECAEIGKERHKAPRIHHILLEVSSLEKSIAFYNGQFGFEVMSKSGGFAMLKGDNVDIYLWEKHWDWEKQRENKATKGLGMYLHFR